MYCTFQESSSYQLKQIKTQIQNLCFTSLHRPDVKAPLF